MRTQLKIFFAFLISFSLLSCSLFPNVFKLVINQGNLVDQKMLKKLEVGMTESQVKYVLGTPLISDTFNKNRWDYYTSVRQGDMVYSESKVTLYFSEGKLLLWVEDLPKELESLNSNSKENS